MIQIVMWAMIVTVSDGVLMSRLLFDTERECLAVSKVVSAEQVEPKKSAICVQTVMWLPEINTQTK